MARGLGSSRRLLGVATLVALLAVVAFAVWFFAVREPEPKNDLERFQGEWRITHNGRETPNAVRVSGDNWEYIGGKAYRITLNESANPKEINLELIDTTGLRGAPVKMHGAYAFDGNRTVRVLITNTLKPRPTTLDDPDEPPLVLTKVKLEQDAQPEK